MTKLFILLSSLMFLLFSVTTPSLAASGKCNISKDEAYEILKGFDPRAKVVGVQQSPIEGLCEVSLEVGDKKVLLYIDSSKKNLVLGSIVDVKTKVNLTQQRMTDMNRIDTSQIPLDDALLMGKADAKYKVIVFGDPD
ncbi:hypothetical protein MNBD_NITROSPIRAE02-1134 [hydrothermal vent metagenome]|uniref:Disulphide bond isomerase DsbC/G N-terminal domain-containing protein n=1 Tax=hydrothermal vent metagenome TaxID=652676 RepID=A0A3B1CJT4_9ZZZZ